MRRHRLRSAVLRNSKYKFRTLSSFPSNSENRSNPQNDQHRALIACTILAGPPSILTSCRSSTKMENINQRSGGQQLTDLEQARQQGIISEREYSRLKKAIINKND